MTTEQYNYFSSKILNAALSVHREMGPGLLEAIYHHCMIQEFLDQQIKFDTMFSVPLVYKGQVLNKNYVVDLMVENEIVVELKAVEVLLPVHEAQIISYLKLADKRLGFLINFNVPLIKNGFKRFVNKF